MASRVLAQAVVVSQSHGRQLADRILRAALATQSSLGLTFEAARTSDTRAQIARFLN